MLVLVAGGSGACPAPTSQFPARDRSTASEGSSRARQGRTAGFAMKHRVLSTRRRVLLAELTKVVRWIEEGSSVEITALASADEREMLLRLAGMSIELVRRHRVDAAGRCRQCRLIRSGCRRWLHWPTRKAPCLIVSVASFFGTAPIDAVWWQIFNGLGDRRELSDVRSWLAGSPPTVERTPEPVWPSVDEPIQPGVTIPAPTIPLPSVESCTGRHPLTA
jgi:hypothetical protein